MFCRKSICAVCEKVDVFKSWQRMLCPSIGNLFLVKRKFDRNMQTVPLGSLIFHSSAILVPLQIKYIQAKPITNNRGAYIYGTLWECKIKLTRGVHWQWQIWPQNVPMDQPLAESDRLWPWRHYHRKQLFLWVELAASNLPFMSPFTLVEPLAGMP